MRLYQLPAELLAVALLGSSNTIVQQIFASPTVNVGLQASFNSPPYLLELLYDYTKDLSAIDAVILLTFSEKLRRKKIPQPTSLSLTGLLKDTSRNAPPTMSST